MTSRPLTDAQAIVTAQELSDWLSLDNPSDPLLSPMAQAATSALIEWLEMELITRERELTLEHWPKVGTDTYPSVSPNDFLYELRVDLPFSHTAATLNSVDSFGVDVSADVELMQGKPFKMVFDDIYQTDTNEAAIIARYETGFGTIDDVPEQLKTAVKMLAAYMYEHRGACDVTDAIKTSGAAMFAQPYKMNLVVM